MGRGVEPAGNFSRVVLGAGRGVAGRKGHNGRQSSDSPGCACRSQRIRSYTDKRRLWRASSKRPADSAILRSTSSRCARLPATRPRPGWSRRSRQALPRLWAPTRAGRQKRRQILEAQIDSIYLARTKAVRGREARRRTRSSGGLSFGGGGRDRAEVPLRAIASYYPSAVDQALVERANQGRVATFAQIFAGWAPRGLGASTVRCGDCLRRRPWYSGPAMVGAGTDRTKPRSAAVRRSFWFARNWR